MRSPGSAVCSSPELRLSVSRGNTSFGTPGGTINIGTMPPKPASSKAVEQGNDAFHPEGKSSPPMLDDLTGEHRRKYDQVMEGLAVELFKRFTWTRSGGSSAPALWNRLLTGSTCPCRQKSTARHFSRRSTT